MPRRREGVGSLAIILAVIVLLAAVLGSVLLVSSATTTPGPGSSAAKGSSSRSGSQTSNSASTQAASFANAGCITAIPYDNMQKQFGGCGYDFSILYNGCCYGQMSANGTVGLNTGWTLLLEVRQSDGLEQNVSVGWDPAGPGTSSGERLPAPASSDLFNGSLTVQWRLYGSPSLLYAWIATPAFPNSVLDTTTARAPASCPTTPWPAQASTPYETTVQQIEQNPVFTALTNGNCYTFSLTYYGESQGQSLTTFVFNQYNGTIFYPCGTFPAQLIVSQMQVTLAAGADGVQETSSMWLDNQTSSLDVYNCPLSVTPVWVHSVELVPSLTAAGQTIAVALMAAPEQADITNLTATILLAGGNVTFSFGASPSNPLQAGQPTSQAETIIAPASMSAGSTYQMTIEGSFQNGQPFNYAVEIEIQTAISSA